MTRHLFPALSAAALLACLIPAGYGGELPEVTDHGVGCPAAGERGVVCTTNAAGEAMVLALPADVEGCRNAVWINIDTGQSGVWPLPNVKPNFGQAPFSSLLASNGKYYTVSGRRFLEIDPDRGAKDFGLIPALHAGAMAEDAAGRIYLATSPRNELIVFDPETGKLTNLGPLAPTDGGKPMPRALAIGNDGYLYAGIGAVVSRIVSCELKTGEKRELFKLDRPVGVEIQHGADGEIYARFKHAGATVYRLRNGQAEAVGDEFPAPGPAKHRAAGSQFLIHRDFPDGRKLTEFDLAEGKLTVSDSKTIRFTYLSAGLHLCAIAALPDGTLRGGAMHPMRYFIFDIAQNRVTGSGDAVYQWNVAEPEGETLWIGGYGHGALLAWDTAKPYTPPLRKARLDANPVHFGLGGTTVHRPSSIAHLPGGRYAVMAGTPGYHLTGGGLIVLDRTNSKLTSLPRGTFGDFSVQSLQALSPTTVLCGGTVNPGTSGRPAAGTPPLWVVDVEEQRVLRQAAPLPLKRHYFEFLQRADGLVLAAADDNLLCLIDPADLRVTAQKPLGEFTPFAWHQGPRILLAAPDGRIFCLTRNTVLEVLPDLTLRPVAHSKRPITAGGAIAGGRIWFGSTSRLLSCPLPPAVTPF